MVFCKSCLEKSRLVTVFCITGRSKSARIGPDFKLQKRTIDGTAPRHRPIMDMLLKLGIGADSSTFGLRRYATPCYQTRFFKNRVSREPWPISKKQPSLSLKIFLLSGPLCGERNWLLEANHSYNCVLQLFFPTDSYPTLNLCPIFLKILVHVL